MAKQTSKGGLGAADGMTHLAVPKAHMQAINSSFKQAHAAGSPRGVSSSLLKADPVKLKLPGMPGKNPGIRKNPF